jgi:hypothetical protein
MRRNVKRIQGRLSAVMLRLPDRKRNMHLTFIRLAKG